MCGIHCEHRLTTACQALKVSSVRSGHLQTSHRNPSRAHINRTGSWGLSTLHLFRCWTEGLGILSYRQAHAHTGTDAVTDLKERMSSMVSWITQLSCVTIPNGWFLAWPPYHETTHDVENKVKNWINSYITNVVCFVHFDLQMCFAPQAPAIFHLSSGQLAPHPPL